MNRIQFRRCAVNGLLAATLSLGAFGASTAHAQKTAAKLAVTSTSGKKKVSPKYDLSTFDGLSKFVAELRRETAAEEARERAHEAREAKEGKRKTAAEERREKTREELREERLGFYESRLARFRERVYPNQKLDGTAIDRALAQRDQMPVAIMAGGRLAVQGSTKVTGTGTLKRSGATTAQVGTRAGGGGGVGLPGVGTSVWEFIGPNGIPGPGRSGFGPGPSAGRVNGIAFHPTDPKTIYVAAPVGGVWKTTDGGTTWSARGDAFELPNTSCVAVNPKTSSVVLVGLGDHDYGNDLLGWDFSAFTGTLLDYRLRGGVMRSADGGATWTKVLGLTAGSAVPSIVFDPDNPQIVVAAASDLVETYGPRTNQGGGIYRSTNGGLLWKKMAITTIKAAEDLEIGIPDATAVRSYYCVVEGQKMFRSADQGQTWTQITNYPGSGWVRIAASRIDSNTLFASSSGDGRVYKGIRNTRTNGWTWTNITGNLSQSFGQAPYDFHLQAVAQRIGGVLKDSLYIGLLGVSVSPGANGTWTDLSLTYSGNDNWHTDQHCMAFFPSNPNIMAVGSDGGIYGLNYTPSVSANPPASSWAAVQNLNKGLGIATIHVASFHPTDAKRALGGLQDNGTIYAKGNLLSWLSPVGGDGMGNAINPSNPQIQYASYQGQNLFRTSNEWGGATYITPVDPNTGETWEKDIAPFIGFMGIDPNPPSHKIYVGLSQYIWRGDQNSQADAPNPTVRTWEKHVGNIAFVSDAAAQQGHQIRCITVAPGNSNRIFVGTTEGRFWLSNNYGQSWTDTTGGNGLPQRSITSIFCDPENNDRILVTVTGTGTGHVFQSLDGGFSFSDISGSGQTALPDIGANAVTYDGNNIWLGTDIGVFASADKGLTWQNATQTLGFPNTEVTNLRYMPKTSFLMAATYGRGMWRLPLTEVTPVDNGGGEGNPSGTANIIVDSADLALWNNIPVATALLKNIGDGNAKDVTVLKADLTLGNDPLNSSADVPQNVGVVINGASKMVALAFNPTAQPSGTQGLLKISGTYVRTSDNSVRTFSGSFLVRLP